MDVKYLLSGICVAFVLLGVFAGVSLRVALASARTIYVPDSYTKIQLAIDNAKAGDIIVVRDGWYFENIKVNKSLTIKSENGSANCRVRADNPNDHAIEVKSDHVNISGFSVRGTTGWKSCGIYLINVNYCGISNNDCSHTWSGHGIFLNTSFNNTITNNDCNNCDWDGISIQDSNNNNVSGNECINNNNGITLKNSNNNIISRNNCKNNNLFNGMYIKNSSDNTFYLNNLIDNTNNVYPPASTNIWNSTEKITYTYNGN